jgi:hypothetical protein
MKRRRGGALYFVLLLLAVLVFLGAMVPQVLVQASAGIRHDKARDALTVALDSAIAFGEARLKRDVGDALLLGRVPETTPRFTVRPSQENPDHGPKRRLDWEASLVEFGPHDLGGEDAYTYRYGLQARAWETGAAHRTEGVTVTGLMTIQTAAGRAPGALPEVTFEPMVMPLATGTLSPSP